MLLGEFGGLCFGWSPGRQELHHQAQCSPYGSDAQWPERPTDPSKLDPPLRVGTTPPTRLLFHSTTPGMDTRRVTK